MTLGEDVAGKAEAMKPGRIAGGLVAGAMLQQRIVYNGLPD